MTYKEKSERVLRSVQNNQRKASTVYNCWMLNLVVRKETARLSKVKPHLPSLHSFLCSVQSQVKLQIMWATEVHPTADQVTEQISFLFL